MASLVSSERGGEHYGSQMDECQRSIALLLCQLTGGMPALMNSDLLRPLASPSVSRCSG